MTNSLPVNPTSYNRSHNVAYYMMFGDEIKVNAQDLLNKFELTVSRSRMLAKLLRVAKIV